MPYLGLGFLGDLTDFPPLELRPQQGVKSHQILDCLKLHLKAHCPLELSGLRVQSSRLKSRGLQVQLSVLSPNIKVAWNPTEPLVTRQLPSQGGPFKDFCVSFGGKYFSASFGRRAMQGMLNRDTHGYDDMTRFLPSNCR